MPAKFVPQSPDPFLKVDVDTTLVKYGHINFLLNQINTNVYANNAVAMAAGLEVGDLYRNNLGQVFVVFKP